MLYITDAYKLVSTYSLILLIITVLAIGFGILYVLYLKPKMQFESSEIEVIEPITRKKSWIGIAAYFGCFYIIAIIIQTIIVTVYLLSTGQTELVEESSDYLTILNLCNFATYIVTAVALIPIVFKEIKVDYAQYKTEKKFYLGWWGKGILIMYALIFLTNILSNIFSMGLDTDGISENQAIIDKIMSSGVGNMLLMGLVTVILAPIIEEIVFRKCLFGIFKKNTMLTVIISTFIFAGIHVIPACITILGNMVQNQATVIDLYLEFICIFGYLGQAFAISFVYYKSKQNIIPCILIHFTNNFIAFLATILLQFLPMA